MIRDLRAQIVQNPNEPGHYKNIRVTFYFVNQSAKQIKQYEWDEPSPDENEFPSGGIASRDLLPGASDRYTNIYHTQHGPAIVVRITKVTFADGSTWKAPAYRKINALDTEPKCVTLEAWPIPRPTRSLSASGWSKPIFSDRVTKEIPVGDIMINGTNVQVKLFEISRERLDSIEGCPPDGTFQRAIGKDRDFDYDVEKYESFSANGRVFAYLIWYEYVDEKGQYEIGAGNASFYVDHDGGRRFSLDCTAGNMKPPIPKWVRQLSSAP